MQKITTFLWFDQNALEAANFYVSVFPNAKIERIAYNTEVTPGPTGSVMTVVFSLEGQEFIALNGGPIFKFTPAISLTVNCETQEEIDRYWTLLTADGGAAVECGWLTDKYGLSWQIVPSEIETMISDPDPEKSQRVMTAVMSMTKLDLALLRKAYAG
jgi:predicted 3-demethylubiquinone-9 3-methyltransferase (glyoxalase superfamily)